MINTWTKAKIFAKFAVRDIECGHHSGFRPCCIFCYAILDNLSTLHKSRFFNYRRYAQRVIARWQKKTYGFIPCPICLFRQPVKVIKCKVGSPDHKFNFISSEEMSIFQDYKVSAHLENGLKNLDHYLDQIFLEKDRKLRWY